jgi:rubredoxin
MWLLFHHNAKTRVVRDGHSFIDTCPECGRKARFDEIEVTEGFGLFFVDLVSDKERKYRCSACGDVFDLRDQPEAPAARPAPPAKPARDLERERREAEARRIDSERKRREAAASKANRIEDELAELKKRMGR